MSAVNNVGNNVAAPPGAETTITVTHEQRRLIQKWMLNEKEEKRRQVAQYRFPQVHEAFWSIQQLPRDQQLPMLQGIQQMMIDQMDQDIESIQVKFAQGYQSYLNLHHELDQALHHEAYDEDRVDSLEQAWRAKKDFVEKFKQLWLTRCEDRRRTMGLNVLQFESGLLYWFGLPTPSNAPVVPQPGAQFHAQAPIQPNNTVDPLLPQTWHRSQPYNSPYPLMHSAQVQPDYIQNPAVPLLPSQDQLAYAINPEMHQVQMQPVPIPDLPPVISDQAPDWFNRPGFSLIPQRELAYNSSMLSAWFNMQPVIPNSTEPFYSSANATGPLNHSEEHQSFNLEYCPNTQVSPTLPQISNSGDNSGFGQALAFLPSGMTNGDEPAGNGNNDG